MRAWERWDKILVTGEGINEFMGEYRSRGWSGHFKMVIPKGFIKVMDPGVNHYLVFDFDEETHKGTFSAWIDYKGKKLKYFDGAIDGEKDGNILDGEYIPGIIDIPEAAEGQTEKEALLDSLHFGLSAVMLHMEHGVEVIERSVEEIERPDATSKSKGKGKKAKAKRRRPRTMKRTVYDIKITKESTKRAFERHTEAWTVRGHWRTLKGGRRVWVRPHVKGDPERLEQSVYDLSGM